jgi:hypothetical protein
MKESGIGRENGLEAYHACASRRLCCPTGHMLRTLPDTQTKSIIINIASSQESREDDDWFAESGEAKRYG